MWNNENWDRAIRSYTQFLEFNPLNADKMLALVELLKNAIPDCHAFTSHFELCIYMKQRWNHVVIYYDDDTDDGLYRGLILKNYKSAVKLPPFGLKEALSVVKAALTTADTYANEVEMNLIYVANNEEVHRISQPSLEESLTQFNGLGKDISSLSVEIYSNTHKKLVISALIETTRKVIKYSNTDSEFKLFVLCSNDTVSSKDEFYTKKGRYRGKHPSHESVETSLAREILSYFVEHQSIPDGYLWKQVQPPSFIRKV